MTKTLLEYLNENSIYTQNPLLMTDGYKTSHHKMYPIGTSMVYSNYTPRSVNRMPIQAKKIVVFGSQYVMKYIKDLFQNNFFSKDKATVCGEAKEYLSDYLQTDYDVSHFEALHDLGYLPIKVKSLKEGTIITEHVPFLTIRNTHPDFFWLPNFLETLISSLLWKPLHSASMAYGFKQIMTKNALKTDKENLMVVNFTGHDFSFRGMQHPESAITSGMGFSTSFMGTDTIPVLQPASYYYGGKSVGFSVPASEHAAMTAYGKENEIDGFRRLMAQYATGFLSVVSDSFDLWRVLTVYMPQLKEEIMNRDGRLVIRPDSGDPVDIICGTNSKYKVFTKENEDALSDFLCEASDHEGEIFKFDGKYYQIGDVNEFIKEYGWDNLDTSFNGMLSGRQGLLTPIDIDESQPAFKGVVELLWETFGGTVNEQGYKILDSHVGAIYGDAINLDRLERISERLASKGFATTNVVLGIGSYSLGYATRDNQGGAVKATYVEITTENGVVIERDIFKDPVTDRGTKKSAKGKLMCFLDKNGNVAFKDQCTWAEEETGLLETIFEDGKFVTASSMSEIRDRIASA